ncbi:hypothetical protein QR680_009982 [Steinernema hermaphroditum]|uniref:Uncharacterized protein n=1 Tax=Steinernema hermaphroditum TaxID=289476 RepID=A0AA39MAE1_9BILA|nr:hypothetical protein QR680_009982 [Steinernema hermaphroditum]
MLTIFATLIFFASCVVADSGPLPIGEASPSGVAPGSPDLLALNGILGQLGMGNIVSGLANSADFKSFMGDVVGMAGKAAVSPKESPSS